MGQVLVLTRRPISENLPGYEEWKKMVNGEMYTSYNPYLLKLGSEAGRLVRNYNNVLGDSGDLKVRERQLKEIFGSMGSKVCIEKPVRVGYGNNIHIGNGFYANSDCMFLDNAPITFGDNIMIGPGAHFYTPAHPLDSRERHEEVLQFAKPISVGSNVWIGGRAIIIGGVTVGDGCIIGAGSIVTKDIPPYSLAVGNPARVIKKLT